MSKSEALLELAKRCEAATGPDRELDLGIMCGISGHDWFWHRSFPNQTVISWDKYGPDAAGNPVYSLECFTSSLDAALTLAPDGAGMNMQGNGNVWYAVVAGKGSTKCKVAALAICAAALRARASLDTPPSS